MIPYTLTERSVTVLHGGRAVAIPASAHNFSDVVAAIQAGDTVALAAAIDRKQAIVDFTSGRIEIRDRVLYYAGQPLDTTLTRRILEFQAAGDDRLAEPLIAFLDKVMDNPSHRAVKGLYDWVAASGMPIHPDGDILAWKIVRGDYFDYHSGTLDHSPGNIVEIPRNQCDEDPDRTCSAGIHFCSFSYLPQYRQGDSDRRIMLVKINPRDVVAIPRDYNTAKGRCCRLEVLEQVPTPEEFFPTTTVYWGDEKDIIDFDIEEDEEDLTDFEESFDDDDEDEDEPQFKVGQKWRDSDGDDHIITEVDLKNELVHTLYRSLDFTFGFDGKSIRSGLRLVRLASEPEPEPEPAPSFLPLEVGKTYIQRDNKLVTVMRHDGTYCGDDIIATSLNHSLFADTGRANLSDGPDRDYDIVAAFDPQVGEYYETRGGEVRKVTKIYSFGVAMMSSSDEHNVFTATGKQNHVEDSEHDLIRKVTPIDWTKPIESVDGEPRFFVRFDVSEGKNIAVASDFENADYGNYYDLVTGKHIDGFWPDVRNVA